MATIAATKTTTPATTSKAPKAKVEGEKKVRKTSAQKLLKKHGNMDRSAAGASRMLTRWKGQGTPEQVAAIDAGLAATKAIAAELVNIGLTIEVLQRTAFKPRGADNEPRVDMAPNAQVWVKAKKHSEYVAAFGQATLENLYIDRIIGAKILVRIGEAASEGKVARMIGFVPKGHLTTRKPE